MTEELFDRSAEYDQMLARGLRVSGEDKEFFIAGRLRALRGRLPPGFQPQRVLDFGCGIGDAARRLSELFPAAEVVGSDSALRALEHARHAYGSPRVSFSAPDDLGAGPGYDLAHVNGVFHHIEPGGRPAAAARLWQLLRPGGWLAFFENNPWNPGTRWVMSRIPFDRQARPLGAARARGLLREAGFELRAPTCFLFYFPRPLAFLRFSEPWLQRLPFGAQYLILARKA